MNWHASSETEKNEIVSIIKDVKNIFVLNNQVIWEEIAISENYFKRPGYMNLIYIGRIHKTKNLKFALNILKQLNDTINYDIYGLIEDKNYWKECKEIISTLPSNITVSYCGPIPKKDVTKTMAKYDLMFLPTENENFGQVIFEALSIGVPVLISDKTPWKNLESNFAGIDINLNNEKQYIEKLNMYASMDYHEIIKWKEGAKIFAHQMIDIDTLKNEYLKMFLEVANSK